MNTERKVRVLMVCMGNICRSPTAHGVFEQTIRKAGLEDRIEVDSAGTHAYHVGESPDIRATEAAANRGYDLTDQRARRVSEADFAAFDYVLAMDRSNLGDLTAICPEEYRDRVHLFLEVLEGSHVTEVPDPYYGGRNGFENVLDLVERSSGAWLRLIEQEHLSS